MSGICYEDGSAVYGSNMRIGIPEYKTGIRRKWVEKEKI
jgi:hypothetical protein